MISPALPIPAGCTCNGRSEIIHGRAVLHFTDSVTGSDFTVPEEQATEPMIQRAQREHRNRFMESHRCDVCSGLVADHVGGKPCEA